MRKNTKTQTRGRKLAKRVSAAPPRSGSMMDEVVRMLRRKGKGLHPHDIKAKTGMSRTLSQWDMRNLAERTGLRLVINRSPEGWHYYSLEAKKASKAPKAPKATDVA